MMEFFLPYYQSWFGPVWGPQIFTFVKTMLLIVAITPSLMLCGLPDLRERKIIGYMQISASGPTALAPRVGQPIADALKLMFKEIIIPSGANTFHPARPILVLALRRRVGGDAVQRRDGAGEWMRACLTSWFTDGRVRRGGGGMGFNSNTLGATRSAARSSAIAIPRWRADGGAELEPGRNRARPGRRRDAPVVFRPVLVYRVFDRRRRRPTARPTAEANPESWPASCRAFAWHRRCSSWRNANMILATPTAVMFLGGWLSPI